MQNKYEIHLAVSEDQLNDLEEAITKSASSILKFIFQVQINTGTDVKVPPKYNELTNLLNQVKKERKRISKIKPK